MVVEDVVCVFERVGGARAKRGECRGEGVVGVYAGMQQGKEGKLKQTPAEIEWSRKGCTGGDGGRVLHLRTHPD
jgi:hypothetical protein